MHYRPNRPIISVLFIYIMVMVLQQYLFDPLLWAKTSGLKTRCWRRLASVPYQMKSCGIFVY